MIAGFSTVSVVLGATVAYLASSHPKYREIMEIIAGFLLIGGLGLLGYALECIFGRP